MSVNYSVVIPVKDEEGNIAQLLEEIEEVMEPLGHSWETICIEDGSTDQSLSILSKLAQEKSWLRVLVFSRNFGQSSAFDAGFKAARGNFVITMDGDGQNDPRDIPKFIALASDYDLLCGRRVNRKDPLSKKVISLLVNPIRKRLCNDRVNDTGCSLKLYRRSCLEKIKLFEGMHRFLPALFQMEGLRVKEIPVNHRMRENGLSKYSFANRSIGPVMDMFAILWMRRRHLSYTIDRELPN